MFRVNIFRENRKPGDFGAITPIEFEILLSLAGSALHGYAIIQDITDRSDGALTVRPGTLYRAISRLLGAGLIDEVDDDDRRRYYALTAEGRRTAATEARRLARQVSTARARRLLKSEG
jgi:DNA-binding PadR family transcriptional regulator